MPSGDFKDLVAQTLYASQRDPSNDYDVDRAKEAVNNAYFMLAQIGAQWKWLTVQGEVTVPEGQDTLTYPELATAAGVDGITDVLQFSFNGPRNSPFGHYASWEDFWQVKSLDPNLAPDTPHLWTVTGDNQVQVFPVPDGDYAATFLAVFRPEELVFDTDEPKVPFGWRRKLLVLPAAAALLRQDGGESSMADATAYDSEFQQAVSEAAGTQSQPGPTTHPTPSSLLLPKGLRGASGTLLELAQRVCYETATEPWDRYALERAREAVNSAQRFICDSADDWDFLEREAKFTVQRNMDLYSIPQMALALGVPRIRTIRGIVYDSKRQMQWLRPINWMDLEKLALSTQDTEPAGYPSAFAVWTDRIRFFPTPMADFTFGVYFTVDWGDLLDWDQKCQLPPEWVHEVLIPLASSRVLYQNSDQAEFQRGQVLESVANKAMEKFRAARSAAKEPHIAQYDPNFSADLPGGPNYSDGWYY